MHMFKYLLILNALVVLATGSADAQQLNTINTDYVSMELEGAGQMLLSLLIFTAAIPVCLCSVALILEEVGQNEFTGSR
jgi:hypothetical protein